MKILMVNKFLYPHGGSETYILDIGKQLIQMGHEVQYFGMEDEKRTVGNHAESYTSSMDFHSEGIQKVLYPFKIIYSTEARKKIRVVLADPVVEKTAILHRALQGSNNIRGGWLIEIRRHGKLIVRECKAKSFVFTWKFRNNATVRIAYSPKYGEILLLKD